MEEWCLPLRILVTVHVLPGFEMAFPASARLQMCAAVPLTLSSFRLTVALAALPQSQSQQSSCLSSLVLGLEACFSSHGKSDLLDWVIQQWARLRQEHEFTERVKRVFRRLMCPQPHDDRMVLLELSVSRSLLLVLVFVHSLPLPHLLMCTHGDWSLGHHTQPLLLLLEVERELLITSVRFPSRFHFLRLLWLNFILVNEVFLNYAMASATLAEHWLC